MLRLILFLVLIIAVMSLAPYALGQKGYVLFALGEYTVEMTVISFAIISLVCILAFWFVVWMIRKSFKISSSGKSWFSTRKLKQAKDDLNKGLLAIAENDWQQAKQLLMRNVSNSETPAINYLYAAEAARQLNEDDKALEYFNQAKEIPEASVVSNIRKFEQKLKSRQHCIEEITEFQAQHPKHKKLALLKIQAYQQENLWIELLDVLEQLKSFLDKSEYNELKKNACENCFALFNQEKDEQDLEEFWQTLPRKYKQDLTLNIAYIGALLEAGKQPEGNQRLIGLLKKQQTPELLALAKKVKINQPIELVQLLEKHLKQQPENIDLLRALGYVSANSGNYPLAQKAFNKVCQLAGTKSDWLSLADAAEKVGDQALAFNCYKHCANL